MTLNSSQKDHIANRRGRVSFWRLRGYSQRQIVKKLADEGIINPRTGKPPSLGTVNSDLKALTKEWIKQQMGNISALKARQIEELSRVKQAAWDEQDLATLIKSLKLEMEILGTKAPTEQKIEHEVKTPIQIYIPNNERD